LPNSEGRGKGQGEIKVVDAKLEVLGKEKTSEIHRAADIPEKNCSQDQKQ